MHQLILWIGNTIMWVIEHLWKGVHTYMLKYFCAVKCYILNLSCTMPISQTCLILLKSSNGMDSWHAGNTKVGSITVALASCLAGLESAV